MDRSYLVSAFLGAIVAFLPIKQSNAQIFSPASNPNPALDIAILGGAAAATAVTSPDKPIDPKRALEEVLRSPSHVSISNAVKGEVFSWRETPYVEYCVGKSDPLGREGVTDRVRDEFTMCLKRTRMNVARMAYGAVAVQDVQGLPQDLTPYFDRCKNASNDASSMMTCMEDERRESISELGLALILGIPLLATSGIVALALRA